ncbi:MAG: site-specific DNA-methyltransferase [Deltaproteobacteria bacterium]|nr:site-specific DNA-methyltransferase [Deltaproteobacteria bacterium]
MKKIAAGDPETRSRDLIAENLEEMKELFPEAFTEGKVDFDVLKQLLGDTVDQRDEKYGLNWHGKRQARRLALTPSTGTLRPCLEDSVDWDTTQNIMIEGDNLEALKLLQKSYAGKVKLIYIDPPYNTGQDFIYPDDYRDSIQNYLELTGQATSYGGTTRKLSSNTESSGRFHTAWLNMMYPRLTLAKSLLSTDGFIVISIDHNEVHNLRCICSEIFGEENFRNMIVVRRGVKNVQSQFENISTLASGHEYLLCFSRSSSSRLPKLSYGADVTHAGKWDTFWRGTDRPSMRYDLFGQTPDTGQWRWSPDRAMTARDNYDRFLDEKRNGSTTLDLDDYFLDHKQATNVSMEFLRLNDDGVIQYYVPPRDYKLIGDNWMDVSIKGNVVSFDTEKHVDLMERIIDWIAGDSDIVLDFFAGSGTTAYATYSLNRKRGTSRRWILVQLDAPTALADEGREQKERLSDITKDRLRKGIGELLKRTEGHRKPQGKQPPLSAGNPAYANGDLGFRLFKLEDSNIRSWNPTPSTAQDLSEQLLNSIENIRPDRTDQDLLYELLLKLGLDLCVPVEARFIEGKSVYSVGAGTLFACLEDAIDRARVERLGAGIADWCDELAPASDTTVVFRDSAFVDDVAKTNLAAILEQRGLRDIRSL